MGNSRSLRRAIASGRMDTRPAGVAGLAEGRLNAYRCPVCKGYTVTVDVDPGVTPMTLACRAVDGCQGIGFSLGYPPADAWPEHVPNQPRWEWYMPDAKRTRRLRRSDPEAFDHVTRGGLLLRPRPGTTV